MKKVFLLFVAGAFALAANAQELTQKSVVFQVNDLMSQKGQINRKQVDGSELANKEVARHGGERTTSAMGRWYSYTNYFYNFTELGTSAAFEWNIWNDTSGVIPTSSTGYGNNDWVSLGLSFDPYFAAFNDSTIYGGGIIEVRPGDSYTIDSIAVEGAYLRNNADMTSVDTMKIGIVYGGGQGTLNLPEYFYNDSNRTTGTPVDHSVFPYPQYAVDTLFFLQMMYDATNNEAAMNNVYGTSTTAVVTSKLPLTYADTSSHNVWRFPVGPVAVPPPGTDGLSNFAAASISFVSGSTSYGTSPYYDTLQELTGAINYGQFLPYVYFAGSAGSTTTAPSANFPPYSVRNQNNGYSVELGANYQANFYTPSWGWTTSGGTAAYFLQYPAIDFHITCSSCAVMGWPTAVKNVNANVATAVKAYPNPAAYEVNIACELSQSSDVVVTVSNMMGQVVATETQNAVSKVKVAFNTSAFVSGMYIYSISANNVCQGTGRFVVAH